MSWNVKFFQTARGNYPVKEFIEEQDEAIYAKTLHLIRPEFALEMHHLADM